MGLAGHDVVVVADGRNKGGVGLIVGGLGGRRLGRNSGAEVLAVGSSFLECAYV